MPSSPLTWTLEAPAQSKHYTLTATAPAAPHTYKILVSPGEIKVLVDNVDLADYQAYSYREFNDFDKLYAGQVREFKDYCARHYENRLPGKLKFDFADKNQTSPHSRYQVYRAPAGPGENYEVAKANGSYVSYLVTMTTEGVNYRRLALRHDLEKAFAVCNADRENEPPVPATSFWRGLWEIITRKPRVAE